MRIRTVKPEFWKHEALFDAEDATGLPLRLAYIGLWCVADREGRFKWRPRAIKADIMPYDEIDFSRVLDALWSRGFIEKHTIDSEDYGLIPSFKDHQVINNRERMSCLPDMDDISRVDHASSTRTVHAQGEGKGRERKGREGNHASRDGESDFCSFKHWYNLYAKKTTRKQAEAQWAKMSAEDRQECIERTPAFVAAKPDKGFRPDPIRFLRDRRWEDEIDSCDDDDDDYEETPNGDITTFDQWIREYPMLTGKEPTEEKIAQAKEYFGHD